MKELELLHLAALLHDIGKFRGRGTDRNKSHQEYSYEFVNEDFADFFAPCGDGFKNAILHHHPEDDPTEFQHLIQKQVILADRLSATEGKDEEIETAALVSILSNIEGAKEKRHYTLAALSFGRDTIIPSESADINQVIYAALWKEFTNAFHKTTAGRQYTPAFYQTLVALLHKYTSRIPSERGKDNPGSDISLYDHLRTTAAIAACIGHELTEDSDINPLLTAPRESNRKICALIKGDISGIQNFLYHILSDGASRQLRGRSFYLQLLTEAIAHWVLKQLDLPITNLLLASGGHFYILAPYTNTEQKFDTLRKDISDKLWALHRGELYCILDYVSVTAGEFEAENFSKKWGEVAENVHQSKQKKWTELGSDAMFNNLFEPHENKQIDGQEDTEQEDEKRDLWQFGELGGDLRTPEYLITFEVPESDIPEKPTWRDTIKAFGIDIRLDPDTDKKLAAPDQSEHAVVYRLGDTDLLAGIKKYQWEGIPVSYDFRLFRPLVASKSDGTIADYSNIADASEGVKWLGALRMDVDDLGTVFTDKLENATISRLATLSEALRLFFEGYVPELCRVYNENHRKKHGKEILELIYAGGDDLFLVGGWSALPNIAQKIRTEFRKFVTGNHITLSGGIAIEHQKFPLYLFADISGSAEKDAKGRDGKDAITFLQKPMSWDDFKDVTDWHHRFLDALTGENQLPRDILTRLSQIYSKKELEGHRWAWRSIYYFHRLLGREKSHEQFIRKLQGELNHIDTPKLRELIHVITRWTALHIRNKED